MSTSSESTVGESRRRRDAPHLTVYPHGPILVRGDVEIVDQEGQPVPRRRRVVALCRCGHSALAPLCDGTHKSVPGFKERRAAVVPPPEDS